MVEDSRVFQRLFLQYSSHINFTETLAYKLISANKPVWHVYDSTVPNFRSDSLDAGPHIVITSTRDKDQKALKGLRSCYHQMYHLPPPSGREMQWIHTALSSHRGTDRNSFIPAGKLTEFTRKFGNKPGTPFDQGAPQSLFHELDIELENVQNVEHMLQLIRSSLVDDNERFNKLVHQIPWQPIREMDKYGTGRQDQDLDVYAFERTEELVLIEEMFNSLRCGSITRQGTPVRRSQFSQVRTLEFLSLMFESLKRRSSVPFSQEEPGKEDLIILLKNRYRSLRYTWASEYIGEKVFETLTSLSAERLVNLIQPLQKSDSNGLRMMILHPFVNKLLVETGVIGRLKSLET
jgi:hypothetical protein